MIKVTITNNSRYNSLLYTVVTSKFTAIGISIRMGAVQ